MWNDKAKREGLALALILATTLGGWHVQQASASSPARSTGAPHRIATPKDPVDGALAYGDLLDAVQYQLGFEPDARDVNALRDACLSLGQAEEPEAKLREAAAPIVRFCLTHDESDAERAADAFVAYREAAFDVAD